MPAKRVRFRDESGVTRSGTLTDGTVLFGGEERDLAAVDLLPPVEPTKIVGVGRSYRSQLEELGEAVPERPTLFLMPPKTLVGHENATVLPNGDDRICFEGEIGVVIGEECRDVPRESAANVLAGYTCVNDITDFDRIGQGLVKAKAFDGATPIGPAVAPPQAVPDDAQLELRVNGERRQRARKSDLLFSVPELVEYVSSSMTLEPGDVISTGTPAGVGPLADGDEVEVELEGVGVLRHDVRR